MKPLLYITLALSLLLAACAQQKASPTLPEPSPFQDIPSTGEGITLALDKQEYSFPVRTIDLQINNRNRHTFTYGKFFYIEKEINGSWYTVMYSDNVFYEFPTFKDYGLTLHTGRTEQLLHLEKLGLSLEPGTYRVVKTFTNENGEVLISASFKVMKIDD